MVEPWMAPFVGTALILCAVALLKFVKARAEQGGQVAEQSRLLEQRLAEVERRLTDIQEVVLAIDEKLEHLELKKAKE